MALGLVLGPPIVAGFTYILQHTSAWVALYLWGFVFALQIFFLTIYPIAIAPLFNKFDPLPDSPLRCASARRLKPASARLSRSHRESFKPFKVEPDNTSGTALTVTTSNCHFLWFPCGFSS